MSGKKVKEHQKKGNERKRMVSWEAKEYALIQTYLK